MKQEAPERRNGFLIAQRVLIAAASVAILGAGSAIAEDDATAPYQNSIQYFMYLSTNAGVKIAELEHINSNTVNRIETIIYNIFISTYL